MARKTKKNNKKRPALKRKKNMKKTSRKATKAARKTQKKKVQAIPKGYNHITPYLIVEDASKAIHFYKSIFGAKEVMRMDHGGGKIGHAELRFGDTKIMLADEYPDMNVRGPKAYGGSPVSIHLYVKNVDGIIEKAISSGATLNRPVETMFYGDRIGSITDPFGHKWSISTHVEDVPPREMKKRMMEFFEKEEA